ncbi:MAG: hypothetical protein ACRD0O_06625 [Acidimicrobiia bacterium]
MLNFVHGQGGTINLQATLSSSSAGSAMAEVGRPHHPITCPTELRLETDGTFACAHSAAPAGDTRTQSCINHSVAVLLIELAQQL